MDADTLAEFILARIAEVELMAHDASGRYAEGGIDMGDHWQWESETTDYPIDLSRVICFANVDYADYEGSAGLRSEEEYSSNLDVSLPAFALSGVEELRIGPARHIAYWDPARVLAECEAKRRIVEMWEDPADVRALPDSMVDGRDPDEIDIQTAVAETVDHIVRLLGAAFADHPDYRPEWAPET